MLLLTAILHLFVYNGWNYFKITDCTPLIFMIELA